LFIILRQPSSTLFPYTTLFRSTVTDVYARLNGMPLEIRRIASPIFSYWLPPTDNVLQFFGTNVTGTVKQAYSDGYWVYLAPLPRSEEHTSELQSRSDLVCRLLL